MPRSSTAALRPTLAYYGAFLGLGLVLASLGPTLPALAAQAGVSLGAVSAVFVGRSGGYLAGALLGGRLFDRWPGHPLLAAMLAAMAVCMALVPAAAGLWPLAALFALLGLAEGSLDAGGNTLLTWLYPSAYLGPWMNGLHFAFGVGAFLSPLVVAAALARGGGIELAYRALAALLLPVVAALVWLPSPRIAGHAREGHGSLRPHRATVVLAALLLFAAVGIEVGYGNWIYVYAVRRLGSQPTAAALLTSAFWGAFTAGRLLAIPLAARLAPGVILVGGFSTAGAAAALPLVWPASAVVLWIAVVTGGLAAAPLFATTLALANLRMPISGRVTGFLFIGSSAGGMSVPWLVGQLVEPVGPASVFAVILAVALLGLLLCLWLRRGPTTGAEEDAAAVAGACSGPA